jgi:alkanesulfonate monooxygenase SsuD/methylene tetrahydromethanopterin reductase-like flavin-dependent oxidoreductase (luciferase family)
MKFGLIMVPQVLDGQREPYQSLIEQIEYAEELGYDSVWLTEHHFSGYGRPSVPVLAGQAAARTRRIRIGTAVAVLPFHHPIQVAEDWATVDQISNGRVEFGIGRGNQPAEFKGLNVPMDEARERMQESLAIIRKAWSQKTVSHDGRFWQVPEIEVLPKPIQKPHPPIWQAAVSNYTTKMIIEQGINGLIGPYLCPFEILKEEYFDVWHEGIREAGRLDLQMCHNEFVWVGDSDDQVKADIEKHVMWYVRTASKLWGERVKERSAKQFANFSEVLERFEQITFDEIYNDLGIFGTPETVAEKVRWMRDEGGVDYLMNFMWFGGIDHGKAMRNMERFAKEVMPEFREPPVGAADVAAQAS